MKRWPLNKAYFWETAPFFRVLLPFAAGIVAYEQGAAQGGVVWAALAFIALAYLLYAGIVYAGKNSGPYPLIAFVLLNGILLCSGFSVSYMGDVRNDKKWFGKSTGDSRAYLVRLSDNPVEKEHTWKIPATVINTFEDGKVSPACGNAFLYMYKDGWPMLLHKGDSVLVPGKWQPIKNAGNPYEFDYAGYCRRNNILYQQFCAAKNVRLYAADDPAHGSIIDRSHDWCMAQLDKYITDAKTKGLIQAMLLGDEVNLDEDLRQSYSETGIVHIIAISGGNVAIFFIVISFVLRWLRNKKHLWIKYAVALPLVWFYVVMAGAQPSAVRAAIMFSLLAFAVMLQKNNNSLNQLFATAFLLLCVQPMWLFSVGFQLSFVAVLSLILFYTPVYKWLSPVHKITKKLWGTVAASIAAEILVAPLVVYYFHNFPLLFIVANVAAFIFMNVVLIMSMCIIALSWIPVVAKLIGICTVWLVAVFDRIVTWLQGLNPVSFRYLVLTGFELLLLYFIIAGIILFLMKKQKPALFIGLGAGCLLLMSFCKNEWDCLRQQILVVYNTSGANQIELIKGNWYSVLRGDTVAGKKVDYAVKPAHIGWRAWRKDTVGDSEIFDVGGNTILILNKEMKTEKHFHADYVVINYSGVPDAEAIEKVFSPRVIVIGNNYPGRKQEEFIKQGISMGIKVHAVGIDGAFVLDQASSTRLMPE